MSNPNALPIQEFDIAAFDAALGATALQVIETSPTDPDADGDFFDSYL